MALVQAALLLSSGHSSRMDGNQDSSYWLAIAIRFAKSENMHLHDQNRYADDNHLRLHRRIWQCCILRDRLLSLALHRPLQIPPDHHEYDHPIVSVGDFEPEFQGLTVESAHIKRRSVDLLIKLCELAVHLTPLTNALYPQTAGKATFQSTENIYDNLKKCQMSLDAWHATAPHCDFREFAHKPTFLQVVMLHIYYQ